MTEEEIEAAINEMKDRPEFHAVCVQYDELLRTIGSVEDDEIIALILVAKELSDKENIDAS